jgi:hypothetical protein
MNSLDLAKIRREEIRWHLLRSVNLSSPAGIYTEPLLAIIIRSVYPDATHQEIRVNLDYLEEREMVRIAKDAMDRWSVDLTRTGIDFVEYTIDAQPGIFAPRLPRFEPCSTQQGSLFRQSRSSGWMASW